MSTIILADLDGCIANNTVREQRASANARPGSDLWWDYFQDPKMIATDVPVRFSLNCAWLFKNRGYEIKYLSGRSSKTTVETGWWLKHYDYPDPTKLYLKSNFGEKDVEFKTKWAQSFLANNVIKYAIDNNEEIYRAYLKMGIDAILVETNSEDDWHKLMDDLITGKR